VLRQELIAEAAYFRAERRGFVPGFENEDWYAAEREVNERLATGKSDEVPVAQFDE
jgi:hypothetical protein